MLGKGDAAAAGLSSMDWDILVDVRRWAQVNSFRSVLRSTRRTTKSSKNGTEGEGGAANAAGIEETKIGAWSGIKWENTAPSVKLWANPWRWSKGVTYLLKGFTQNTFFKLQNTSFNHETEQQKTQTKFKGNKSNEQADKGIGGLQEKLL